MEQEPNAVALIIEGLSEGETSLFAAEVEALALATRGVTSVERAKTSQGTMDLGATVIVALGGAGLALAKGIADWLRRRNTAKITVKSTSGHFIAEGLTSADALKLYREGFGAFTLRKSVDTSQVARPEKPPKA